MPHHTAPQYTFTQEEFSKMQARRTALYRLKDEVMERLKAAREMGDLSENGAYQYAKFELGNIRRELRRLNHLLEHGQVATIQDHYESIEFGSTFTLENTSLPDGENREKTYMLVSEHESDPMKNKLSDSSPIGKAVVHKKVGDTVTVITPRGEQTYTVTAIQ